MVRDTLDVPSTTEKCTISLAYDHLVVETFVNILHTATPVYSTFCLKDYEDLHKLCDFFEAPDLVPRVNEAIKLRLKMQKADAIEPWNVFQLAAKRHDIDLMVAAISAFGISQFTPMQFIRPTPSRYCDIPGQYAIRLMKFAMVERRFADPDNEAYDDFVQHLIVAYVPQDSSSVAKDFEKESKREAKAGRI